MNTLFEYSIQTISGTPSLVHQVVGIQEMSVFWVCVALILSQVGSIPTHLRHFIWKRYITDIM